jgi:hypothetical protein
MRNKQSGERVIDRIEDAISSMDERRARGLERLKSLQDIKSRALEKEQLRLSKKEGAGHPRVRKVASRLAYNQDMLRELDVEIESAGIKTPTFDGRTWMVHGRVLDENGVAVQGLTVSLFDEDGNWIRQMGHACTDERGHFAIVCPAKKRERAEVLESERLLLTVTDKESRILHQDSEPLYLRIGRIDYREILLAEKADVCASPEPRRDDTQVSLEA